MIMKVDRRRFIQLTAMGTVTLAAELWPTAPSTLAQTQAPPNKRLASFPNGKAGSIFDQAEEQTQRILAEMENSLRIRLNQEDVPFSDALRMQFIQLAMWPPIAKLVQGVS